MLKKFSRLENAKNIAVRYGGNCLSVIYINSKEKLTWKCKNPEHKPWNSTYSHVNNGTWCPECGKESMANSKRDRTGLEIAKKHAESKGGKCLSGIYVRGHEKLTWKCKHQNHKYWDASYNSVVNKGSWCRKCSKEKDKKSL